jgi:hypothetical protein
MHLERFSMGIGDRFGRQGAAQLAAFVEAGKAGVEVTPVWNKSFREHSIVGTDHSSVRAEADAAVKALGWAGPYRVDADHIGLKTVDQARFIPSSDFFTLDVADYTGKAAPDAELDAFAKKHANLAGTLRIPGIAEEFTVTPDLIRQAAAKYLLAVKEAGGIYRHVENAKGAGNFIAEVSMDETDAPQTPLELLFILAAIADERIPAQTIAPKFSGRFNKGVDYAGDPARFAKEFEQDVLVIAYAVQAFGLPAGLKLSVHSGSDKFAIYPAIRAATNTHNAGVHVKTAGTTWLEEVAGLAAGGGEGLQVARDIYRAGYARIDELTTPYATVIDIDRARLPEPKTVDGWSSEEFAAALRHDRSCPAYNPHLRQLVHVAFRVAAEMGERFRRALEENRQAVARGVTGNLWQRHMKPLFVWEE